MTKQKYTLESPDEFQRLEEQSSTPEFDFRKELGHFHLPNEPFTLLDAGSGSGIVSRYLANKYSKSEIYGCDLSSDRVNDSQQAAAAISNLEYQQASLDRLPYSDQKFDVILSRYVFQHLPKTILQKALNEMYRCLKPGGQLMLIDVDGFLYDIYPRTPILEYALTIFETQSPVDLRVGRKLRSYLHAAGFQDIHVQSEAIVYEGESLEREIIMTHERLEHAAPVLIEVLGAETAEQFKREFTEQMRRSETTVFYNKFFISGVKKPLRLLK